MSIVSAKLVLPRELKLYNQCMMLHQVWLGVGKNDRTQMKLALMNGKN